MGNLDGLYSASDKESSGFELLPAGQYLAVITESSMNKTKAGDGEYLKLTLQILDGPHKNRKIWDNLNLKNPSDAAVEIARGTLSRIRRATGVAEPKDSSDLHDKPVIIKVAIKDGKDGEPRNVVKDYKVATAASAQAPAASRPTAPWTQKK